jgi:hypothetical protein
VKTHDTNETGLATALRHLHGIGRHVRSNVVAYLALGVAVASGGSYALAATASNGTIAVCVDRGSGVMHLAKHPRCARGQSRIGLGSALARPSVSAWAGVELNGAIASGSGASVTHTGTGRYNITVTAPSCRNASNNAPLVSINDSEPPYSTAGASFPVAWTETAGTGFEAFTVHTGVVVGGAFQPRDESFSFTDSCR